MTESLFHRVTGTAASLRSASRSARMRPAAKDKPSWLSRATRSAASGPCGQAEPPVPHCRQSTSGVQLFRGHYTSMCSSRTRSSLFILRNGGGNDLFAKVPAELSGRPKVDFATDHLRKLHLHANQAEVSRAETFFELHEQVDIAVIPKSIRQNRSEQRQLPDVISLTKRRNRFTRNFDRNRNHPSVLHLK